MATPLTTANAKLGMIVICINDNKQRYLVNQREYFISDIMQNGYVRVNNIDKDFFMRRFVIKNPRPTNLKPGGQFVLFSGRERS